MRHHTMPWLIMLAMTSAAAGQVDDARERQVMERFLGVLEKAPRRGTALDRVYGYHVERGELDGLIKKYQDRVAIDPRDGSSWLLLGLIESQRGRDASAVASFRKAEDLRADDALPSYYLGQALVMVGQPSQAAEAFERALTRRPSRNDLLEIYQALGRVHQRARRNDQSLAVWSRLEALFPDDPRVLEQIAAALAEESQFDQALARYEALAASARDAYRRVRFRTEAADLKVKLGRQADALRDYETLLGGLDPESWLFREVRRKIEEVFTRNDDQSGLARYYEAWIAKTPEDLEAMARLGRTLAAQGRGQEARKWLDRALTLAPSRKALRIALIEQLNNERKYAEVAAQYEALARLEPNNPDLLRDWGRALLKDGSKPEAVRKANAALVWRQLVEARPDDASATALVAEQFRQAGLTDEALTLYRQAVTQSPSSPQYREYLGEYLHVLKRPTEALEVWNGMASGLDRTSANLRRLGDVLAGYGYKVEAIDTLLEAIKLEPDSVETRLKLAELYLEARQFDAAAAQLTQADALAIDEAQRDDVLTRLISVDEAAGRLTAKLNEFKTQARSRPGEANLWRIIARYAEAARQPTEAISAAEKAVALGPDSILARTTLARLYEANGRFGESADAFRVLATIDRRSRTEHLAAVARLEARLGRRDEALRAGRELLAASPGNPETAQLFADLCFQLGENEEALETLRRASRANEADPRALNILAEALTRDFRLEEAIEIFWRAFDRSPDLEAKLGVVARLADLHLQRNQFDRLTARLERIQREDGHQREGSLFLAQAYATLGDFGAARAQIEGLLELNAKDLGLLKQLARLAEDEGDYSAAVKYFKQIDEIAPTRESSYKLLQTAVRAGEIDVAEAIWARNSEGDGDKDLARVLSALDNLFVNGRHELVLTSLERLLRKNPGQWEVLYRKARVLGALGRVDESARVFRSLLELRRDDDEVSAQVIARRKGPKPSANATASTILPNPVERVGVFYRQSMISTIRLATGLEPGYSTNLMNAWVPLDFGQARLAVLAHLMVQSRRANAEPDFLNERQHLRDQFPNDPRALWDDFYMALLQLENRAIYERARTLALSSHRDPSADFVYLESLAARDLPSGNPRIVALATIDPEVENARLPLPPDEVNLILESFRSLLKTRISLTNLSIIQTVMVELKRAGRSKDIDADYRVLVASAKDLSTIDAAENMAEQLGDLETLNKLGDTFDRLTVGLRSTPMSIVQPSTVQTPQGLVTIPAYHMARAIKVKADEKAYADILQVVDHTVVLLREPSRAAQRVKLTQVASATSTASRTAYPSFLSNARVSVNVSTLVDYPSPNRYLDYGTILILRNAFAAFKNDEKSADLLDHLRKSAAAASNDPQAVVNARLVLSAVLWWSAEWEEAIRELSRVVELVPGDVDLKLQLAELRATRRQYDEALALVDSVEATEQDITRRRELLALRLAVLTGRGDRARQAAERLFGLRLDTSTQVSLAAQMHQLGLHELADSVLARTRRQVGNSPGVLVSLMLQYQRQGSTEAATQVALQVLRRLPAQVNASAGMIEEQTQAIQVLAASGKLPEMIERAEAQVKLTPHSIPLLQTLSSYYRAARRTDKLKATFEAMTNLRPDDMTLRLQVATQLVQVGETTAAVDQYRAGLKKDPNLLATYADMMLVAFQQAGQIDEFVKLLDPTAIKAMRSYSQVGVIIQGLLRDPKTADQGEILLDRAMAAYPNDIPMLLNLYTTIEPFWTRPRSYDIGRSGIVPPASSTTEDPWYGLNVNIPVQGPSPDGRMITLSSRVLDVAARLGKLDDLASEVEAARVRLPKWQAGSPMLGVIRIRQGRFDEARRIFETMLADPTANPQFETLAFLGQEVRQVPEFEPITLAIYERTLKLNRTWTFAMVYFTSSPIRHLAILYHKNGRDAEARSVASKLETYFASVASTSATTLVAYRRIRCMSELGGLFVEIGQPAEALRVYHDFLSSTDDIQAARGYPIRMNTPPIDFYVNEGRRGVDKALHELDKAALPSIFSNLLGDPARSKTTRLLTLVNPREVDRGFVTSLYSSGLDLLGKYDALRSKLQNDLEALVKAKPDDIESQVALALLRCSSGDPAIIAEAASNLDRIAEAAPLGPLDPSGRSDAAGRDSAARRLGLWLVARTCWKQDSTFEVGERLGARALEAARRQTDPLWAWAMLRERAQVAADRGDRKGAEARWMAILDQVLTNPMAAAPPTPGPSSTPIPTQPPTPRPARPGPAGVRVRVPAFTIDRFIEAAECSRLLAEQGLVEASFRAIRESLRGGPPVLPISMTSTGLPSNVIRTTQAVEPALDSLVEPVEARLSELDTLWTRQKADPVAVYELLRSVVLPDARPLEIFLYDPSSTTASTPGLSAARPHPALVGPILARRAVAAGREDDLKKRVADRQSNPMAKLAAKQLLTWIEEARKAR